MQKLQEETGFRFLGATIELEGAQLDPCQKPFSMQIAPARANRSMDSSERIFSGCLHRIRFTTVIIPFERMRRSRFSNDLDLRFNSIDSSSFRRACNAVDSVLP